MARFHTDRSRFAATAGVPASGSICDRDFGSYFVTAVGGGGKTTDVLHTDAVKPSAWEKFTLWFVPSTGEYGIQTLNGEFLFATNGGALASLFPFGNQEVDTIQSTAEYIIDYERFRISGTGSFTIRTVRGFYLIAVGGGRQTDPPALYTNGTAATATYFGLLKSGDAGSGYSFGLVVAGGPATVSGGAYSGGPLPIGSWVIVSNGGDEDGSGGVPAQTISPNADYAYEVQLHSSAKMMERTPSKHQATQLSSHRQMEEEYQDTFGLMPRRSETGRNSP